MADIIHTKPSDMLLQLYLRPIHPEFFKIFSWRTFKGQGYEAQLWITGLSHVLTVCSGKAGGRTAERCLAEVIGPPDENLPDRGRVHRLPLLGEDEAKFTLRNGFIYQLSFNSEVFDSDENFAAAYKSLYAQSQKNGLACEYRTEGLNRELWPLALMMPDHARGGFLLHAFHVFPDQRTILKTQTLVEIPTTPATRRQDAQDD